LSVRARKNSADVASKYERLSAIFGASDACNAPVSDSSIDASAESRAPATT
jgi:hypothetical protein